MSDIVYLIQSHPINICEIVERWHRYLIGMSFIPNPPGSLLGTRYGILLHVSDQSEREELLKYLIDNNVFYYTKRGICIDRFAPK